MSCKVVNNTNNDKNDKNDKSEKKYIKKDSNIQKTRNKPHHKDDKIHTNKKNYPHSRRQDLTKQQDVSEQDNQCFSDLANIIKNLRVTKKKPLLLGYFVKTGDVVRDKADYDLLSEEGLDYIVIDTKKGDTYSPVKKELFEALQSGDTIVVYRLSHLTTSIQQFITITSRLCMDNVQFRSVSEDWADSNKSDTNNTYRDVILGLSELSESLRLEKSNEAVQRAKKKNGVGVGRSLKANASVEKALAMYHNNVHNYSINKICELNNISRTTFWRRLRDSNLQNESR